MLTQGADAMPVTAGLNSLNGQWVYNQHLVSAGSIIAALPPVLMFFLMQKHFIAGLTLRSCEVMKHWRLDTDNQTLVLSSLDNSDCRA